MVRIAGPGGQRRIYLCQLLHPAVGLCAWLQLQCPRARWRTGSRAILEGAVHAHLSHLFAQPDLEPGTNRKRISSTYACDVLDRSGAHAASAARLDPNHRDISEYTSLDHVG